MVSIGPTIRIEGETNFRAALRRIYSESKTLEKEMESLKNSFSKYDSELTKNKKTSELLTKQIEAQKNKVDATKTAYEAAAKKFNDTTTAYEKQSEKVVDLNKKYENQTAYLEKVKKEMGENSQTVKNAEADHKALGKELEQEQKKLDKLNNEVMRSSNTMEEHKGKVAEAEGEYNKLKRALEDIPNTLQTVGHELKNFGDEMADFGSTMTKYVTTPLVTLAATSVKQASDFEDGMHKIYTIAEEGTKPMSEMREELIALSRDTGYSLDDLSEAAYQAVSASVSASDATSFLATAADLARAGFTSTTQSVDLLTTVMNAYGKETYDAAYISDVLLRTQNDGKTIIDELAGSMGTVIPTAANYNISLEQLAAAYATMTKQGVNTARATTFMNAMFTELEKEGSTVADILEEETGKSFAQLMDEGYSLADVLKILYTNVGESDEEFQRLFGNVRSGKAAAALTADDFSILNYEIERMGDTSGQTAYALDMLETPSLQAKRALNNLKLTAVDIGEVLMEDWMPTFEWAVGAIKDIATAFHNLDPEVKTTITRAATLAAAIGPVLWAGGKVLGGIGTVIEKVGDLSAKISAGADIVSKYGATAVDMITKFGPAVGITAAVAAGMVLVADATYKSMEEDWAKIESQYALTEEMKKTSDAIDAIDTYYDEQLIKQKNNIEATLLQTELAKNLVDEYNNLVDETGQVAEENQALADVLIDELCEALGMSKDDVKELIDENGKFTESMDEVIAKLEEEAKMTAVKELLKASMVKQIEAQRLLEQSSKDVAYQEDIVKQTEKALDDATQDYLNHVGEGPGVLEQYRKKMDDARAANVYANDTLDTLKETERQAQRQVQDLAEDHDYYMGMIAQATAEASGDMAGSFDGGTESMKTSMDDAYEYIMARISQINSEWARQTFTATVNVGYNLGSGIQTGISEVTPVVQAAAKSLGLTSTKFVARGAMVNSPSKATMETGKYIGEGLAVGMDKSLGMIDKVAQEMAAMALGDRYYIPEPSTGGDRNISAPISVSVNVNGNVDDVNALADAVAEKINNAIRRDSEVFA